jgi:hypothetical protein
MRPIARLFAAALAVTAVAAPRLAAQGNDAFHAEVFGASILGSFNYERMVGSNFSARVGLGYLPGLDYGSELLAPVMVNFLAGTGVHRVEVGAGAVLAYGLGGGLEDDPEPAGFDRPYATATLAYRLEPGEESSLHGGIYRIGFTPVYFGGELYPSFGFSAGFYLSALRKSDRAAAVQRR